MNLDARYPALSDLKARAKRRIPHFVWEYMDSGTGDEVGVKRNRQALDDVLFMPAILKGEVDCDLSTTLMGKDYALPFGIAPVGSSGAMWPDAEVLLAKLAAREGIPYCLSTVATRLPEETGPVAGGNGWFQLYPPYDEAVRQDILKRVKAAGFHTLVLTADVPTPSRRERQVRGGLSQPLRITPRIALQIARCPAWALGTLKVGSPRFKLIEDYAPDTSEVSSVTQIGKLLRTSPDWEYVSWLRSNWDGKLVVKGVMRTEDAKPLIDAGVDALWVSNHAARQLDATPAAINVLPEIRAEVGPDVPLIYDSGVQGGLDIMRALARGADFVMLGKAFHYGLGAFGAEGAAHVVHILREDMKANMSQIGVANVPALRGSAC